MENTNASVSQSDTTNDVTNDNKTQQDLTAPAQTQPTLDNLTDDEAIDLFIYGIMNEKGTAVGSDEMQGAMMNDLKNKLLQEIDRSLIAELPDDKLEELNKIVTEKGQIDPTIVADMVQQADLDVPEIVGNTMAKFRELYLGLTPESANNQPIEEAE